LPITLLFNEEKAFAYRLTDATISENAIISNRGPMIAGVVAGDDIILHDKTHNKTLTLKSGKETYIEPGISFYLTPTSKKEINLVLFELK
jgi:hypothetical protein